MVGPFLLGWLGAKILSSNKESVLKRIKELSPKQKERLKAYLKTSRHVTGIQGSTGVSGATGSNKVI